MNNQLFILVKTSRMPVNELAKRAGVSRQTIGRLIGSNDLPRDVKIETLDKIAYGLGYQVKVEFLLTCPDCNSITVEHVGGDNYRCECGIHFAA